MQNCFNPRSRVGSDSHRLAACLSRMMFQSTLPRGERQPWPAIAVACVLVSIHAPAWGATMTLKPLRPSREFQSTLPRGERPELSARNKPSTEFQSTLPRGERPRTQSRACRSLGGALRAERVGVSVAAESLRKKREFQSTLPRGERPPCGDTETALLMFQSTLPRGERPLMNMQRLKVTAFQSTLPRGERPQHTNSSCANLSVSIHAPAWGATTDYDGKRDKN